MFTLSALIAGLAMVPLRAQNAPQGWPETPRPAAKVVKAKTPPPSVEAPTPAPRPGAPAATEPAPEAAAPKSVAPTTSAAPVTGDLVEVLQRQSDLLARLATELDAQRRVVDAQRQAIATLEAKVVAPAATPAPAAALTVAAPPAPKAPVITVETGGAKLKLSGLVQGWFQFNATGAADTFRLRRTEIKISGEANARLRWTLMFDPAKSLSASNTYVTVNGQKVLADSALSQGSRMLQDAFVSVTASDALTVDVGQQKLPLSLEGPQSSARLEMIDRALFMTDKARGAGYGDVRDVGVMARGRLFAKQVEYYAGVFDGLGETQNDVDKNDQKAWAARVVYKPKMVKGLQVGGSLARGAFRQDPATRRDRQGVELQYVGRRMGVKGEWMTGADGAVTRSGAYGQVSFKATSRAEVLFRTDRWDPDTRTETATTAREIDVIGGVNLFGLAPNTVLQANYVRKTFTRGLVPSRQLFLLNLQTAW